MRYLRYVAVILLTLSVVAISACSYHRIRYIGERFSPTSSCEIYLEAMPDRRYTEVAQIEVRRGDKATARAWGMKVGADAILLVDILRLGGIQVRDGLGVTGDYWVFLAVKWK